MESGEILQEIEAFMETCVEKAGLDLTCRAGLEDKVVTIRLEGGDGSLLIRDNARLLYALNHLVNQAFFRRANRELTFVVDHGDYRNERVMELQLLARKAAERVRQTGAPFRLQAMPASERRTIHLTLAGESDIRTESEGGGPHRKIVIFPSRP